jgi:hypothetical protein
MKNWLPLVAGPEFAIQKLFVKDVSFEAPGAPNVFLKEWRGETNVQLNSAARALNEAEGVFEVELRLTVTTTSHNETAYLVEVKSHPREESIVQMKKLLGKFRDYFPEHRDKAVFGILAAVDISPDLRKRALAEGLYVARIHNDVFTMDTPEDFRPKAW